MTDEKILTPYGWKRTDFLCRAMDAYELLRELVDYEHKAFDGDFDVDGAELVEWFAEFRQRAKGLIQ